MLLSQDNLPIELPIQAIQGKVNPGQMYKITIERCPELEDQRTQSILNI